MSSRRIAKVSEAIREAVSSAILLELRDPRIRNVTVLGVDVDPDLRNAKVRISIMGTEKEQGLCLHGLSSSRGFLQSKVADRIKTKYTPILSFKIDDGIKKSLEATRILNELFGESNEDGVTEGTGTVPGVDDGEDTVESDMNDD